MVFDDGVTSRLADDRFHMTTTTGNAAAVLDHLEEWLQTEWPDLRVHATSVTEQWATVAVVGPRSRDVVAALAPSLDVSNAAFPFMTWRDAVIAGTPGRVFRISFSGELAYELNVPTWHGLALWEAVLAAGAPFGITPYGTQAMHVLRAEKGYPIIGQETDGTVTPQDLGMAWAVSTKKDFIGRRSHRRLDAQRPDRKQLVGLLPTDPRIVLPEGTQLVAPDADLTVTPVPMLGHVTSSYESAAPGPFVRPGTGQGWPRADRSDRPRPAGRSRRGGRRRRLRPVRPGEPSPRRRAAAMTDTGLRARSPLEGATIAIDSSSHGRDPRIAVPGPGRPPGGSRRRAVDVAVDDGPRRSPADRPEHHLHLRGRHQTRSCGWGPMSGSCWASPAPAGALESKLRSALDAAAGAVVDLSANRTAISVSGPRARESLAFGCAIDLDPPAFGPGRCAQTLLARANVIIVPVGPAG
ncbi:MAG: hypothetical protein WKF78_10020 [Candidatus Limnocylindrales bacterium]